jgi:cell wall assembly regulator SMI1
VFVQFDLPSLGGQLEYWDVLTFPNNLRLSQKYFDGTKKNNRMIFHNLNHEVVTITTGKDTNRQLIKQ